MQAQTSTRTLAVFALVAFLRLFLELPRWAQLSVLAAEVMVLALASILLWPGESCHELAHASQCQAVLPQPLVLVPLKGERDDAETDVETESTAGTDAAATDYSESDAEADSDWSSSEDVDMPCNSCSLHAAWEDVGTRLATVFLVAASEPITSDDEGFLIVPRCTAGRASADLREVAAFGLSSADSDGVRDENDDHHQNVRVSSSKNTCVRLASPHTQEGEASVDPWVTVGRRLSAAFNELSASALDDEEDVVQSTPGWSAVADRVAAALRQIASGEPMHSNDEDDFLIAGQDFARCNA